MSKQKILRATHFGFLNLVGVEVPCAVLEDGRRVLTQRGLLRALGRNDNIAGGYGKKAGGDGFKIPENVTPFYSKMLQERIKRAGKSNFSNNNGLKVASTLIPFILQGGQAHGYDSDFLVDICFAYSDAADVGALQKNQMHIAHQCKALIKAFAHTGLAALIDEATGYQKVRPDDALQKFLDRVLAKELQPWRKRFSDEFYEQLYRLREYPKQPRGRPMDLARITADLVYSRLGPEILDSVRDLNPFDESGVRINKHHQWLSEAGQEILTKHLDVMIVLMKASSNWNQFRCLFDRVCPPKSYLFLSCSELPFENLVDE